MKNEENSISHSNVYNLDHKKSKLACICRSTSPLFTNANIAIGVKTLHSYCQSLENSSRKSKGWGYFDPPLWILGLKKILMIYSPNTCHVQLASVASWQCALVTKFTSWVYIAAVKISHLFSRQVGVGVGKFYKE